MVCLVDGGTLRLLSQVPGLEDRGKVQLELQFGKQHIFTVAFPLVKPRSMLGIKGGFHW